MTTIAADSFTYDKTRHVYRLNGQRLLHTTEVLQDVGHIDPTYYTEESRERGRVVHEVTAHLDRGGGLKWDTLHVELQGFVESWLRLRDELRPTRFLAIEHPIYHPLYLYGTTPDRVLLWEGRTWVWEFKTVKAGHAPYWTKWQTAAQDMALGPCISGLPRLRAAVELYHDGAKARLVPHNGPDHFNDGLEYLAFLSTTRSRRTHGISHPASDE